MTPCPTGTQQTVPTGCTTRTARSAEQLGPGLGCRSGVSRAGALGCLHPGRTAGVLEGVRMATIPSHLQCTNVTTLVNAKK